MNQILQTIRGIWRDERGELTVEYGLLVAVIAVGMLAVLTLFGAELNAFFSRVTSRVADLV